MPQATASGRSSETWKQHGRSLTGAHPHRLPSKCAGASVITLSLDNFYISVKGEGRLATVLISSHFSLFFQWGGTFKGHFAVFSLIIDVRGAKQNSCSLLEVAASQMVSYRNGS